MAEGDVSSRKGTYTLERSSMGSYMARESLCGKMGQSIKENSR